MTTTPPVNTAPGTPGTLPTTPPPAGVSHPPVAAEAVVAAPGSTPLMFSELFPNPEVWDVPGTDCNVQVGILFDSSGVTPFRYFGGEGVTCGTPADVLRGAVELQACFDATCAPDSPDWFTVPGSDINGAAATNSTGGPTVPDATAVYFNTNTGQLVTFPWNVDANPVATPPVCSGVATHLRAVGEIYIQQDGTTAGPWFYTGPPEPTYYAPASETRNVAGAIKGCTAFADPATGTPAPLPALTPAS